MKNHLLIIISIIIISSCTNNDKMSDSHVIEYKNDKIYSEQWERNGVTYLINYDENDDLASFQLKHKDISVILNATNNKLNSFQVSDKNLSTTVNLKEECVMSYQIKDKYYSKIANIKDGNIISGQEEMPLGTFLYSIDNNTIKVTKLDGVK